MSIHDLEIERDRWQRDLQRRAQNLPKLASDCDHWALAVGARIAALNDAIRITNGQPTAADEAFQDHS